MIEQPKIRRALMADVAAVDRVLCDPEVYPHTVYDGKVSVEDFTSMPFIAQGPPMYVLIDSLNTCVAMLSPINSVTLLGHSNVLPKARGKYAVRAFKAVFQWLWNNTPSQVVMGLTPVANRRAVLFAQWIGMSIIGRLTGSVSIGGKLEDMYITSIHKGR